MTLTAAAAKALATIILRSTVGAQFLDNYIPLHVISDGAAWMVCTNADPTGDRGRFRIVIDKTTAEVLHFGPRDKYEPPPDLKMVLETLNRQLGFGDAPPSAPHPLAFVRMAFGGVINKPEDAIAYARVLIRSRKDIANVPARELRAKLHAGVWHVTRQTASGPVIKTLKFARRTGKMLS